MACATVFLSFNIANITSAACMGDGLHNEDFHVIRGCVLSCLAWTSMHMVFEGEVAVKLHAKDVEVGISSNKNPRQEQVTIGMAHSPGSTND